MLGIFDNDQWIVEEDAFGLGLTDVMFIGTLAAIAAVPVKTLDAAHVDHVYMMNIYRRGC